MECAKSPPFLGKHWHDLVLERRVPELMVWWEGSPWPNTLNSAFTGCVVLVLYMLLPICGL